MAEMEAPQGASGSPPPFLTKTYDMVDDPSTDAVVSWSPINSTSFVVWNLPDFSRDLLPKYFKHNNFSSFVRQLNTYGFRKVDPDQWEFRNDDFVRGHPELLYKIQRRKPVHSHSLHNQISNLGQLAEQERQELEGLIENLKRDKGIIMSELQNHMQQQCGMVQKMQSLEEKLHALEQRQRYMIISLSKMIQRPGFLTDFMQQSDFHSKRRRFPEDNWFTEDAVIEDNSIQSLKTVVSAGTLHALDVEPLEKMESSLNSLENFFRSVSQASGDNMYYDNTEPCLPSAVIITELNTSSGETGVDLQCSVLKVHSSPFLEDVHSSPEIAESLTYDESPAIDMNEARTDAWSKVSEIDVNSEPSVHNNDSSRDQTMETAASTVLTGVNDVFWEQFLTETPGSTQEVQSERIDSDEKTVAGNMKDLGYALQKKKDVDHEKMGNLSSTKKT